MLETYISPGNYHLGMPAWYNHLSSSNYIHMKMYESLFKDRFMKIFCTDVLMKNQHLIKGKVILDLGCGTGLICMLLSSYGAKVVIGIESCPTLVSIAKREMLKNKVPNVHIIETDVDDIESLPGGLIEVDVIVCQWMGFLFFDNKLLRSLIKVRNRWLKEKGIMMPDSIRLFMVAAEHENGLKKMNDALKFSDFDVSSLKSKFLKLPKCEEISFTKIKTDSVELHLLNLKTVSIDNFSFSKQFELTLDHDGFVHIFVLFFDVQFIRIHKPVVISNSPFHESSFWKQMVLYFVSPVNGRSGEKIRGNLSFNRHGKSNALSIDLKFNFFGSICSCCFTNTYLL